MRYLVWIIPFWNLVIGAVGLRVTGIWGGSEVWRRHSRRWWPDIPWHNKEGEGSEQCRRSYWSLTESDMLPKSTHDFSKMAKVSILYVRVNKPGLCTKGWIGKVVQVLHLNMGGSTDGANNLILLRRMEE